MADSYSVEAIFKADIGNYTRGVQEATRQMQGFEKQNNSGSEKVQKALSGVSKTMKIAGAAITGIGIASIKSYGRFSDSMNQTAVIAGGTSKDIDGLRKVALKMGQDLPISAEEAGSAMVEMARNGATVGEIKKEFPAIAKAATAAGADLTTTAGVVQQAMNVWGDSLEGPQQAAVILMKTANLSNASIESMQQALATMGPAAKSAGMNLEDTSTAIGLLTNKGTSSAEAAQELRHALIMMQAPSNKAADAAKELGLNFYDAQGHMKPFPQILNEVADAVSGLSDSEKEAALKAMFNTAGMQAMLPLLDTIKDKSGDAKNSWSAYSSEIQKVSKNTDVATKTLDNQAAEMQKSIGAKLEQVGGSWDSLSKTSMMASEKTNGALLDMASDTLNWATNSNNSIASVIRKFLGFSPVIGPAMTIAGAALGNFNTVMLGAKNISGMATGAFKLLTAPVRGLAGHFTKASSAAKGTNAATSAASSSASKGTGAFSGFTGAVLKLGVGIGAATAGIGIMAVGIAALASTGTQGIVTTIALAGSIIAVTAAFALFAPALTAGSTGLIAFGIAIAGVGIGIGAASLGLSALILAFIKLTGVMNAIVPTMTNIGVGFATMIGGFLTKILSFAPQITAAFTLMIKSFVTAIATNTPLIISSLVTLLLNFLNTVANNVGPIVNAFLQILIGFINTIAAKVGPVVAALTNLLVQVVVTIGNNAGPILGAAVYAFGKITEALIQVMPLVIQILTSLMIALVTILNDYIPAFSTVGGELMKALAAGIVGKKYDPIDKSSKALKEAGDKAKVDGMSAFDKAGGNSAIAAAKAIANKSGDAKNAGSKVGQSGASGVSSQSGNARNSGSKVGSAAASGISSKSGNAKNSGSRVGQSGVSGISSKTGSARNAGSRLGSSAASAMNKSGSAHNAGNNVGAGFANGLSAQFGNIMRIAGGIANSVMRTIKHALSIHSPSRKMKEIGSYTGQGMLIGLQDQLRPITEMAEKMADAVMIDPQTTSLDYHLTPIADGIGSLHDGSLSMSLDSQTPQPTYISLNMGGDVFSSFVDDIQNRGGQRAQLKRGNSFR